MSIFRNNRDGAGVRARRIQSAWALRALIVGAVVSAVVSRVVSRAPADSYSRSPLHAAIAISAVRKNSLFISLPSSDGQKGKRDAMC